MKFGAIDIGTNAVRLLIGEVVSNGDGLPFVKKVSYTRVPLRLGMDVFSEGKISDHKIVEFRKTMEAFKLISEVFSVVELRACATSAMREAKNGEEVRRYVEQNTGVKVEIISGDEEAGIILSNFLQEKEDSKKYRAVIDVGGGSTEISVFKGRKKLASKSFAVGTLRMLGGKVKDSVWEKMKDWLKDNIKSSDNDYELYATGGNINKIHKMLGKKSSEKIHIDEFNELTLKLLSMPAKERISKYKLKTDRADVIGPACEIYDFIFKQIKCKNVIVPRIGLSDGMIHGLHLKNSVSQEA